MLPQTDRKRERKKDGYGSLQTLLKYFAPNATIKDNMKSEDRVGIASYLSTFFFDRINAFHC